MTAESRPAPPDKRPVPYALTAKGNAFLLATHHSFAVYGTRRDPCFCPSCQQPGTPGHGTATLGDPRMTPH